MILSILIMSLTSRLPLLELLLQELNRQIDSRQFRVEVIVETDDGSESYSSKYRRGLLRCRGHWVCSIDDDDWVSSNYIVRILEATYNNPLAITFNLLNYSNGEIWSFVKGADDWTETSNGYIMKANQLCAWKRELLLRVPMPDLPYGSDVAFCYMLNHSGEPGNANRIPRCLYHYRYNKETTQRQRPQDMRLARVKADGGLNGWRHTQTGNLYISEFGRAHQNASTILVRSAEGSLEEFRISQLTPLFEVTI